MGASEQIDLAAAQVQNHDSYNSKSCESCSATIDYGLGFLKVDIAGKRILVIGSQWPWLEFVLLARYLVDFLFYLRQLGISKASYWLIMICCNFFRPISFLDV